MLSILMNWIYIGCIVYICGCFLMQLYMKLVHKNWNVSFISIMLAGVVFTTLYAQIFSLFYKVSLLANLTLILFCLIYCIFDRQYIKKRFMHFFQGYKEKDVYIRLITVLIPFITIVCYALCSAGPAKLIDTDWYHAQTIRWIEEFGCVKGVANLFYALGFNNAQHYFDALFSMKELLGQSLRGTGGFFGLIVFMHGFIRLFSIKKRTKHIADYLALWEIAYSIIITAFYADPYTDTLPNVIILIIMTEWIAMLEEREECIEKMAYYCLLGIFATIAKTSAAMIVLLCIQPITILVRNKRTREIFRYIVMGFALAIPYLATNIITTGYPISLLTVISVPVRWKVDKDVMQYAVDNMIQFARMPLGTMEEALNCGLRWIPGWFLNESISHQILYISICIMIIYDMIKMCGQFIFYIKGKENPPDIWMILPRISIYIGIVYWLFTIPQVKYCWAYLIIPIAVIPVYYMEKMRGKNQWFFRGLVCLSVGLLVMYSGFYGIRTMQYMKKSVRENLLLQQDYENHVFNEVNKNGHTFYTRIEGGDIVCGYYIFPYLDNEERIDELMVGENLGDGFYFK